MAKFDLKKAILENKATFFSSLTEGQFSWMTQDTGQQIGSQDENKIPVYMFDNKGKYYYENDYDGYGEFGGKDYYDLVAEMNGYTADDAEKFGGTFGELRGIGIKLAFGELEPKNGGPVLFPALVTKPDKFNYKSHNFAVEAETDPNQSWYEPEEDEEDNSFDLDDDEEYGYNDDEEELDENKVEEAYNTYSFKVAKKFAEYMSKKEGRNFKVTPNSVDEYSFDLDLDGESYEGGSYLIKGNGDIVNVAITPNEVYGNINQLDENKEAKPTTKMKKSELKAKIKEMIVAEYEKDVDYTDETAGYDFLAELEGMLNEAEGLTPLQDYVYQYEIEISGEDRAQDFLDDIRKLNTPQDVYDYYAYGRDLQDYDVDNIFKQVKRKFANLDTADDLTPLQRRAYNYTKERFGNDEAKKSLDQIKTLKTNQEFTDWVLKKVKAEDSLNEADETEKDTAEVDTTDITVDDTETIDTETEVEVDPNVKAVQDALTQAQVAAQKLGDPKLTDQIGNTITFFTREHVVEKPKSAVAEGDEMKEAEKEDLNESMFPMLKKILK